MLLKAFSDSYRLHFALNFLLFFRVFAMHWLLNVFVDCEERDWEDMKKMPEHQTLVKDFKKSKYVKFCCMVISCICMYFIWHFISLIIVWIIPSHCFVSFWCGNDLWESVIAVFSTYFSWRCNAGRCLCIGFNIRSSCQCVLLQLFQPDAYEVHGRPAG